MTKEIGDSTLLDTWAADGTIVEPGSAKKDNGWDLGEQPPHEYANWVLNIMGKAINHVLQNGMPAWNATTTYAEDNFCSHGGVIYKSKQENTDSEPPNANWQAVAPHSVRRSLEYAEGFLQLVNDVAAPGNNKIYGTNGSGVRGWQNAPVQADGFKTGDLKLKYGSGAEPGFVRLNGGTLGKGGTAATERANDDTEALYTYLYNEDENLVVSGGRGADAATDFAAGKVLTLPDAKNAALAALDGMGQANSNRLTTAYGGVDGKKLGAIGGDQKHNLTSDQNGEHWHYTSVRNTTTTTGGPNYSVGASIPPSFPDPPNTSYPNGDPLTSKSGKGDPHNNVQPTFIFGTLYIKL